MKILLDFDNTTADLDTHMRDTVNARFGTNYQIEDNTHWDWWFDSVPGRQAAYGWGEECFLSKTWTMDIPPVEGAIDGIHELLDEGHTLVLVSDRPPHMGLWLKEWLQRYRIAIPVHTTNRHEGPTKLDVIRKLGLELVIEDAPHHAIEMSESGLVDAVFLLDKPWNRDVLPNHKLGRCFSWDHILDTIRVLQLAWGA